MDNIEPEETPEAAIDQYNMWIDLALRKADLDDWDGLREMVQETPFASSYLYCAVRAYRDLLERHDRETDELKQQLIQVAASRDDEVNALRAERDALAEKLVFRGQNP